MLPRLPKKTHPSVDVALSGRFAAQELVALNGLPTTLELSQGHIVVSEGAASKGSGAPQVPQSAEVDAASELVVLVMSRQEFDALLFEPAPIEASVSELEERRQLAALPVGQPARPALNRAPQLAAIA